MMTNKIGMILFAYSLFLSQQLELKIERGNNDSMKRFFVLGYLKLAGLHILMLNWSH